MGAIPQSSTDLKNRYGKGMFTYDVSDQRGRKEFDEILLSGLAFSTGGDMLGSIP